MLFDDRDLSVFEDSESRKYFQEILQCYYSRNYRATVVLLYSFVIYDLYKKLQTMANEGDKKASEALKRINEYIKDDEKYSMVESSVVNFFLENCPLYFNRFEEDIVYLKHCRNKCAHLKVDDNSLFVPKDYHVRMLICSMFDNILSVKAPFIIDLFSIAQLDIEKYTNDWYLPFGGQVEAVDDAHLTEMKNKYFSRMTYDSLKKSLTTFLRLLFVSSDEEAKKFECGLYIFTYGLIDFASRSGYTELVHEESIRKVLSKIDISELKNNDFRKDALKELMIKFNVLMDEIREHEELFDYIKEAVVDTCLGLKFYYVFCPREAITMYGHFKSTDSLHCPNYADSLYITLKDQDDFNLFEFLKILIENIPSFNGFHSADVYMKVFLEHKEGLKSEEIDEIMKIYNENNQCTGRSRHNSDMAELNKYLESLKKNTSTDMETV